MPRGLPGGAWVVLELTGTLKFYTILLLVSILLLVLAVVVVGVVVVVVDLKLG